MNWYKRYKYSSSNYEEVIPLQEFLRNFDLPYIPEYYQVVHIVDGGWAVVDMRSNGQVIREEASEDLVTSPAALHRAVMTICFIEGLPGCEKVSPRHRH